MDNFDEIKDEVRKVLTRDIKKLIYEYEDNLAISLGSEVQMYDPNWCIEENNDFQYKQKIDEAIKSFVDAEMSALFKNKI